MERIGRYDIISELGRGAMGIVYRARDTKIGREVAIKTIRLIDQTAPDETSALRERLFREAQSAGRLSHPGIVTIYDIAEESGMAYITMEFVEGRTLEDLMQSGEASDTSFLCDFLHQTGAALDYAHSKEIVHRDVKPANMMITPEGGVKITDFGIARIASSKLTQTGTVMGTPSYMSPEQVRGDAIDGRSDQFSLGVIAYELLTGEKPFAADTLTATIFKIVSAEPTPPRQIRPEINAELDAAVLQALAKEPPHRHASCRVLAECVSQACGEGLSGSGQRSAKGETKTPPPPQETIADLGETAPAMKAYTESSEEASELDETVVAPPGMEKLPPLSPRAGHSDTALFRSGGTLLESETPERKRRRRWTLAAGLAVVVGGLTAGAWLHPWLLQDPLALVARVWQDLSPSPPPVETRLDETARNAMDQMRADVIEVPELTAVAPPVEEAAPEAPPEESEPPAASTETPEDTAAEPKPEVAEEKPAPPPPPKPAPRPPALETVQFKTPTPGVRVVVDGKPQWACTTPCSIELPRGRHELLASMSGHRRLRRSFPVNTESPEVTFELTAIEGTLLVSSRPTGADIYVDGKKQPDKTNGQLRLPPGYHLIRVTKSGAGSAEQSVFVAADELQTLPFVLREGGTLRAKLVVKTSPAGANIVLNDNDRRGRTPTELDLAPGEYLITLSRQGYRPVIRRVELDPTKPTNLEVTLSQR